MDSVSGVCEVMMFIHHGALCHELLRNACCLLLLSLWLYLVTEYFSG